MAITITLNGREVSGSPGQTILDVAKRVGVEIPTLCHHPLLRNAGACRVCLVEDVKTGRLQASCVTPISQGMEIRTHSPNAIAARRGVLELILSDHPSSCVICSKGNDCILRTLAKDHGICDPELDPIRHWRQMQEVNPFIVRDLTKCVMCGRCIRVCKDFEVIGAVEYTRRGYSTHPGTAAGTPLEGSECTFCGSCVSICPTDALAEKHKVTLSSGTDALPGICSFCGTGCSLHYKMKDGLVIAATGIPDSPVNSLSLCVRGHFGQDALSSPERLTEPLLREADGSMRKAVWEEALGEVAEKLNQIIAKNGPESVGILVGSHSSNEEAYLTARLARGVIGTPHVDYSGRFFSGPVLDGLEASFRSMPLSGSLRIIEEADTVVLMGARPDYTHPVVARNVRRAVRGRGAALIQFDPLVTSLTPFARIHWMKPFDTLPDTLVEVMREIVLQKLHDTGFLQVHVRNGDELLAQLRPRPDQEPAPQELKEAARLMGGGRKTIFLLGHMAAGAARGYILGRLLANLALLCGRPDNVIFLFDGSNEAGVRLLGCVPDRLPGALVSKDLSNLEDLRLAWGTEPVAERGLDAMEMIRAAESGELKALLLFGVDPSALFPETERTRRALSNMSLVVRTGMFPPVGAETAHAVLPTAAVTETDGTYVNLEGQIQRVTKMVDPPGHARATARFILDLAGMLGSPLGFITAKEIFEEITSVCPSWRTVEWEEAGKPGGVRRDEPPLGVRDPGDGPQFAPYMLPRRFTPSPIGPPDRLFKVYPEEVTVHPGDGVQSRMSFRLGGYEGSDEVRMHPEDASMIGAAQGTRVVVRSEVGEITAAVKLDPDTPRNGLVMPAAGSRYLLQKVLPWPEEHCPLSWDRVFVSVSPVEGE